MSLRGTKRSNVDTLELSTRPTQVTSIIGDKGYSCSCSPFECVCGNVQRGYSSSQTGYQLSQNHHNQSNHHHNHHNQHHQQQDPLSLDNPTTPMYNSQQQQMTGNEAPVYWSQEPIIENSVLGYTNSNCVAQEASSYPSADFPTVFATDLFPPEEIFQLDQPIRSDFGVVNNNEIGRSPPSLLDLGSGTIKYEMPDIHEQTYWTQLLSEDSSSSHISVAHVRMITFFII